MQSRAVVQDAVDRTGMTEIPVQDRTRLLSDNGSGYVSRAFRDYLQGPFVRAAKPLAQERWSRVHSQRRDPPQDVPIPRCLRFITPLPKRTQAAQPLVPEGSVKSP